MIRGPAVTVGYLVADETSIVPSASSYENKTNSLPTKRAGDRHFAAMMADAPNLLRASPLDISVLVRMVEARGRIGIGRGRAHQSQGNQDGERRGQHRAA